MPWIDRLQSGLVPPAAMPARKADPTPDYLMINFRCAEISDPPLFCHVIDRNAIVGDTVTIRVDREHLKRIGEIANW